MGVLDLPAPALSWIDAALGGLPLLARIVAWGAVGAGMSTGLYWGLSPQRRLGQIRAEERLLKGMLRGDLVSLKEGMSATRRLLVLALARIGLTLGPALAGALPVLCLMIWAQTRYGHDLPPPGQIPSMRVYPDTLQGRWVADATTAPRVEISGDEGQVLQSVVLRVPVPVVHKRMWWNGLAGNPVGYLADDGPADRLEIDLPERHYLSFGPDWMRGWEAPFLTALLLVSIGLKLAFRIR